MIRVLLTLVLVAAVAIAATAMTNPATKEDPVVAFARDFSGGDAKIVAAAERFVANPPTDTETIGFHGAEKLPPRTRAFQATVSLLASREKLISSEDKYSSEFVPYLVQEGHVVLADLPPTARMVFGPMDDLEGELTDTAKARRYRDLVWANYARATQELEAYLAGRGKVLLSIDATDGDTMMFALVSPAVAERWRDRSLGAWPEYESGVRSAMWDRYWANLTYAVPDLGGKGHEGPPPGTRRRRAGLTAAD